MCDVRFEIEKIRNNIDNIDICKDCISQIIDLNLSDDLYVLLIYNVSDIFLSYLDSIGKSYVNYKYKNDEIYKLYGIDDSEKRNLLVNNLMSLYDMFKNDQVISKSNYFLVLEFFIDSYRSIFNPDSSFVSLSNKGISNDSEFVSQSFINSSSDNLNKEKSNSIFVQSAGDISYSEGDSFYDQNNSSSDITKNDETIARVSDNDQLKSTENYAGNSLSENSSYSEKKIDVTGYISVDKKFNAESSSEEFNLDQGEPIVNDSVLIGNQSNQLDNVEFTHLNEKNSSNKKQKYLIFYLFIIILLVVMYFIYFNIKNKNSSLLSENNSLLSGDTIDQKKDYIEKLNNEIESADDILLKYKNENSDIDKNISDLTLKNDEISKTIEFKREEVNNKKSNYQQLYKKYIDMTTVLISNVMTYNQYPNYPNGCEAVALYILLRYYGVNVSIDEVIDSMPTGSVPYMADGIWRGGDPNYEFLGDPRSVDGWGIFDNGLSIVANKFKSGIINGTGMDFSNIYSLINNRRPVIVWTSIDLKDPYVSSYWISDKTGETITWKRYNHALVIIGYDEDNIIVSDPINGQIRYFEKQKFIFVYDFMGRRALYY